MASLHEVAKAVLTGQAQLQEGVVPSVSKDGDAADRDANKKTANAATLRPKATPQTGVDATKKLEGEVQDLGAAVVKPTDSNPDATVGVGKDKSKAAQSKVPGQKPQSLGEGEKTDDKEVVVEEKPVSKAADRIRALAESLRKKAESEKLAEESDEDSDIEISEEVLAFVQAKIEEGLSEEEIYAALDEEFEVIEEDADDLPQEMKDFIDKKIEEGLSQDEVMKAVNEEFGEKTDKEVVSEEKDEERVEEVKVDMTEHVEALFAGETLSEDFKSKAKTILETAVNNKLVEEKKKIEEQAANSLAEELDALQEEMASNVDDYLAYVVEDWANNNQIAIDSGLKTEITEEFISGLRQLFMENYIDIPAEKINVVEEMATKMQDVEKRLNEEIAKNVELTKQVNQGKKEDIVAEAASSLTQVQREKFKTLVEGVEYSNLDEFKGKIETIKNSYFASTAKPTPNAVEDQDAPQVMTEEVTGRMGQYIKVLGKHLPN